MTGTFQSDTGGTSIPLLSQFPGGAVGDGPDTAEVVPDVVTDGVTGQCPCGVPFGDYPSAGQEQNGID